MLVEPPEAPDLQELLASSCLSVRIRYRSRPIPCRAIQLDNGCLLVKFVTEASAITPGQSAVFYDGNRVLGGGFSASQQGIHKIVAEKSMEFDKKV